MEPDPHVRAFAKAGPPLYRPQKRALHQIVSLRSAARQHPGVAAQRFKMRTEIKLGHTEFTECGGVSSCTIPRTFLADQSRIPFADQRRRIVIKKRQESIAPSTRHPTDLMQE